MDLIFFLIIENICFKLMDQEQRTHDLKVQWTTVQGHHKESMDQLSENSRQLAALKTELHKSQQQNQALTEEVKKN
jgi:hypothetical protein